VVILTHQFIIIIIIQILVVPIIIVHSISWCVIKITLVEAFEASFNDEAAAALIQRGCVIATAATTAATVVAVVVVVNLIQQICHEFSQ